MMYREIETGMIKSKTAWIKHFRNEALYALLDNPMEFGPLMFQAMIDDKKLVEEK